jgi:hypothetical protein
LDEDVCPGAKAAYARFEKKPHRADGQGGYVLELEYKGMQKEDGYAGIAKEGCGETEKKFFGKPGIAGHG